MATKQLAAALKLAEDRNLRFVSLQFTDIVGQVKSVQVPMHQLEEAVEHGKWFDGSSIEGFARIAESDMFLVPDLDTFAEIPWESGIDANGKQGATGAARVICDVFTPHGEPFPGDPRWVLRRQLDKAKKLGYVLNTGPELEFFLLKRSDDAVEALPHDAAADLDGGHGGLGIFERGLSDFVEIIFEAQQQRQQFDRFQVLHNGEHNTAHGMRIHAAGLGGIELLVAGFLL